MTQVRGESSGSLAGSLRDQIRGAVLAPGADGYEAARSLWNAHVDRRPALIVQPSGVADVQRAVAAARVGDLELAIRCGGHNAAGLASTDGGLMIHLDKMRQVRVDPEGRRAWCQGGANWGDYDRETHAFGLASTGGAISTTGVAGLTLGGGLGVLMRKHGLTIDNLKAVELVTADSTFVRASAESHPDLFWAVRGGGGNFGVATAFEFELHEMSEMWHGFSYHPIEAAGELMASARDLAEKGPDETMLVMVLGCDPQGQQVLLLQGAYAGDRETGKSVLAPLRNLGDPLDDDITWLPYPAVQCRIDELFPAGMQVYWRAHFIRDLNDEVLEIVREYGSAPSSPLSVVVVEQMGGAVARVPSEDTVFEYRDAGWQIAICGRWTDDDPRAEEHIAWVRSLHEALLPFAHGTYVNYLGVGESADRVRVAYPAGKWERLVAVKDRYDPDNVFHRNQNIPPSIGEGQS